MKRIHGGSSPIKQAKYKAHYDILNRKKKKTIDKVVENLREKFGESHRYTVKETVNGKRKMYAIIKGVIK